MPADSMYLYVLTTQSKKYCTECRTNFSNGRGTNSAYFKSTVVPVHDIEICVCANGSTAALFVTPKLAGVGGERNTPEAFPFGKETTILNE